MTIRTPDKDMSTELAAVQEELDLVTTAMAEHECPAPPERRPWFLVRLWRRYIGHKVYDGPEDCAHCRYWTPPRQKRDWNYDDAGNTRVYFDCKGDCALLFGEDDTLPNDTCHRFTPHKKYWRRKKEWKR